MQRLFTTGCACSFGERPHTLSLYMPFTKLNVDCHLLLISGSYFDTLPQIFVDLCSTTDMFLSERFYYRYTAV